MPLLSLPVELLNYVYRDLSNDVPDRDAITGLHSLCLTSRRLHDSAKPHLYHNIDLGQCRILPLLLTLRKDSSLASKVKKLQVNQSWNCNYVKAGMILHQTGVLPKLPETHDLPSILTLQADMIDFILSLLPAVEEIDFELNPLGQFYNSRHSYNMPGLHSLKFSNKESNEHLHIEILHELLQAPSLHDLTIATPSPIRILEPLDYAALTSLKELNLYTASMEPDALEDLIRSCPSLESLTYETIAYDMYLGIRPAMPSEIITALQSRKKTLRKLNLTFHSFDYMNVDNDVTHFGDCITDLRYLTKLEELNVPSSILPNTWIVEEMAEEIHPDLQLPTSLKKLEITRVHEGSLPMLGDLSRMVPHDLPNFKNIKLVMSERNEVVESVKQDFVKLGVNVKITSLQ
ncbi:hypothetical protein PMZ80_004620 [Knufia obscura]|uniref:F-box/LRR-repeat protein 15/At3g58940/PEG3-like LRR domain-containing protein n=1 Tax=Knufia obscura TaxID=1635080 RepID=A0ABR0RT84_9EURO|nr:hypothetical protein PMZ80_004620 [Knufia obscura]